MISASTAKKVLETSERADISIEKVESTDTGFITPHTMLTIFAKNHGRTRGSDVTVDVFIGTKGKELRRVGQQISQTVIPPETTAHILISQAVNWLDPEDFGRLSTPHETYLIIRIELSYMDAFGNQHHNHTTGDLLPHIGAFIAREIDAD